jgi:hypothetical protein
MLAGLSASQSNNLGILRARTTIRSTGVPCSSTVNSLSGTVNSVKQQSKQIVRFGNTHTMRFGLDLSLRGNGSQLRTVPPHGAARSLTSDKAAGRDNDHEFRLKNNYRCFSVSSDSASSQVSHSLLRVWQED